MDVQWDDAVDPNLDKEAYLVALEKQYGLDNGVLKGVWNTESAKGRAMRTKLSSAKGHFQFIDSTAKQYGLKNPDDFYESADAAARHLSDLKNEFGDMTLALAAYKAGPGAVRKHGINAPAMGQNADPNYINKVYGSPDETGIQWDDAPTEPTEPTEPAQPATTSKTGAQVYFDHNDPNAVMQRPTQPVQEEQSLKVVEPEQTKVTVPEQQPMLDKKDYWGRSLQTLPKSAENFVTGIANMVAHPVDTVQGLGKLAGGAIENVLPDTLLNMLPDEVKGNKEIASRFANDFKNTFGSAEQFNESFANDPIGTLSKVSLVTGIPSLALRSGSLAAKASGAPRTAADLAKKAKDASVVSTLTDPLVAPIKVAHLASKVVTKPIQATSGLLTGLGYGKLGQYVKDAELGKTGTLNAIRGNVKVEEIAGRTESALTKMAKDMHDNYVRDILPISGDATQLSLNPVVQAVKDAESLAYKTMSGGKFSRGVDAERTLKGIKAVVNEFKRKSKNAPTVMDLDALKQRIFDVGMKPNKPGTTEYKLGSNIYNAIKKTIEEQAPAYSKVMKRYSDMKEEIHQIQHVTAIKPGQSHVKSLNKLFSLANAKPEGRGGSSLRIMDKLSKYDPDLMGDLAGVAGHGWANSRTIGAGTTGAITGALMYSPTNPSIVLPALGLAAATSPRLAAETAYKFGQGKRLLSSPAMKTSGKISLIDYLLNKEGEQNER